MKTEISIRQGLTVTMSTVELELGLESKRTQSLG